MNRTESQVSKERNSSPTQEVGVFLPEEDKDIKFLVFLRVSDHLPKLDENQKAWVRNQREKDRERFKQPQTKASQRFKVRSLLVNDEEFESYDSAMEYAVKKLEEWHNSIL